MPFKRFRDYVGRDGRSGGGRGVGLGVKGQYLAVKFPWACGRAPRSSHDGFGPDDEETEKSGFLVF